MFSAGPAPSPVLDLPQDAFSQEFARCLPREDASLSDNDDDGVEAEEDISPSLSLPLSFFFFFFFLSFSLSLSASFVLKYQIREIPVRSRTMSEKDERVLVDLM